ncbi:MAG: glycosyltransferase [bacterium]|nr:glycosyltransferase [bacterium]
MDTPGCRIVILGLSITSSWGNGHAATYRGLVEALHERGHDVLFLERDTDWYAANRDLPTPPWGETALYHDLDELRTRYTARIEQADLVMVGSYVPEGIAVGRWVTDHADGVTAFYDIDTPITIAAVEAGTCEYLTRDLIPHYDVYFSFTGGGLLDSLQNVYGAQAARPLYCAVNPAHYFPEATTIAWDMGYMGTYSPDRQPALEALMFDPARAWRAGQFVVVGPQYPPDVKFPANMHYVPHLAPPQHRTFYNAQRFTLNLTRREMIRWGYSPSIRLFEAAACATPILTDAWEGLETFFTPGEDILIVQSAADTLAALHDIPEAERLAIGRRARARILRTHTPAHRAAEIERWIGSAAAPAAL